VSGGANDEAQAFGFFLWGAVDDARGRRGLRKIRRLEYEQDCPRAQHQYACDLEEGPGVAQDITACGGGWMDALTK
jgi:hypothetical protein